MTPGAFFGYDLDTFKTDSAKFAEMIWKSIRYVRNIRGGNRAGNPEADAVTERVLTAKRLVLIGLAPFMSPIFVPGLPRDTIAAAVRENVKAEGPGVLDGIAGWHILCLEDLAIFLALAPRESLGQAILDYVRDMGDTVIDDDGMTPSFRNWCIHRYRPLRAKPLPAAERAIELLRKHATEFLFRKPPDDQQ